MTTNHPAHGPVSLDRLHQIREILSKAATQSDGGNLGYAMADAVKVIDGAIAAFGAEPVAWKSVFRLTGQTGSDFEKIFENREAMDAVVSLHERGGFNVIVTPLYTAPPAPVVQEELFSAMEEVLRISDRDHDAWHKVRDGIASCRAAMLQGAGPVSNGDELPLDYLQGQKDGLEWAAQLAEANHPQTGDWLYDDPIEFALAIRKGPDMPPVQAGNSPVTPDGWVMVPVEPTEDMIVNGFESEPDRVFSRPEVWETYQAMSGCQQAAHRAKLCWAAMVAAAPVYFRENENSSTGTFRVNTEASTKNLG